MATPAGRLFFSLGEGEGVGEVSGLGLVAGDGLGEGELSGEGLGVGEVFFFFPDFGEGEGELLAFGLADGSGVTFGLGVGDALGFGEALAFGDGLAFGEALGLGLGEPIFALGEGEGVGLFFAALEVFRFFGTGVGSKMRLIFVPNDSSACNCGIRPPSARPSASRPTVPSLQSPRKAV